MYTVKSVLKKGGLFEVAFFSLREKADRRVSYTRDKKTLVLYSHMTLLGSWFAPEHEYEVNIWKE